MCVCGTWYEDGRIHFQCRSRRSGDQSARGRARLRLCPFLLSFLPFFHYCEWSKRKSLVIERRIEFARHAWLPSRSSISIYSIIMVTTTTTSHTRNTKRCASNNLRWRRIINKGRKNRWIYIWCMNRNPIGRLPFIDMIFSYLSYLLVGSFELNDWCLLFSFWHKKTTEEQLECLAQWKEGSLRYLMGRLQHQGATSDEDRYRCFVYEKVNAPLPPPSSSSLSPLVNSAAGVTVDRHRQTILLAQSGDASCSGLTSPTEGSRTLKLTKGTHPNLISVNLVFFKIFRSPS